MQQDQADQAYNYVLKKITKSDILEKTDVNHLISDLKEKYSIFKELAFVLIVRAWYSSDCHVQLVNIPKFSPQNDLLEGKTESPQISGSMESIDKIDPGPDIKSIDKMISSGGDLPEKSIDKISESSVDAKLHTLKNQKGIQVRYRTCGKKTCKCASKREEDMHGPYIYKIEWNPRRKKQIWIYQGPYEG